ncbi:nicotinamidase [Phenylobacterium zucineum HLK1]|uniref:Nicotinamidase n=1 Tax=Phenylobacterium zucineum (strain HLK1) TaxID=450851 RepID=B4RFI0_PHEZH|nr:bifunctional nicotinamidase/pyrazinamidase [Phenylobacterium zucineum]ACG77061.1 nicotinamidase [Phenylobacterium zucineum HLK1]
MIPIAPTDALIVIDVQNDFCPGGALAVPRGDEVVAPINRLMGGFATVVLTQDWHPPGHGSFASAHPGRRPMETAQLDYGLQVLWPDHCVQGTPGAAFHSGLDAVRADMILRKGADPRVDSYSAFRENDRRTVTGLAGYLKDRGVTRVFLAGLAFDFCVLWSTEDARAAGFEAVVVEDACRALDVDGSEAEARRRLGEADVRFSRAEELRP